MEKRDMNGNIERSIINMREVLLRDYVKCSNNKKRIDELLNYLNNYKEYDNDPILKMIEITFNSFATDKKSTVDMYNLIVDLYSIVQYNSERIKSLNKKIDDLDNEIEYIKSNKENKLEIPSNPNDSQMTRQIQTESNGKDARQINCKNRYDE